MKTTLFTLLASIYLLFVSCNNNPPSQPTAITNCNLLTDSLLPIQYAKGFKIKYFSNFKLIEVYSPKDTSIRIQEYILYKDSIPASMADSKMAIYIRIPIQSVACFSTTHIAFLSTLNILDCITAVASINQTNNPSIKNRFEEGKIIEIGEADQIQFEKLADLHPQLIFSYEIPGSASVGNTLINKLKIPQIHVSEFLESHPLGQLEWIKFMAAFFDKEQLASHIFDSLNQEYNDLTKLTASVNNKPNVITSLPWKGQWHLPSGNSLITKYIEDAGGKYVMENNTSEGNLVLPIETVYEKALDADYWINTGIANSIQDILNTDQRLKNLPVLKKGKVFNNTAIVNQNGWSDYYESGVVNPNVILQDLIKILHPELLPNYQLHYYKKLE